MKTLNETTVVRDALQRYYESHGLPPDGGESQSWFFVRLGVLRIPLPNPAIRKNAVLFHDIHHLVTGYNTVFSDGEMVIAGYEIGAGCGRFAVAWVINLWMFALGLFVTPRKMFEAFVRGRRCDSLYRHANERGRFVEMTVGDVRCLLGLDHAITTPNAADRALFTMWSVCAWFVTLLTAALPLGLAIIIYVLISKFTLHLGA